jgi:hypothetical protein
MAFPGEFAAGNSVNYALESVYVDSTGKISGVDISGGLGNKKIYVTGELKNDYAALDLFGTHSGIIPLGSVNSAANIRLSAATLSGDLTTTGTATLNISRTVSVGGNLTTGTGAVTVADAQLIVKGAASVGGTLGLSNTGNTTAMFKRDASFADDITKIGNGSVKFEGNVTLAKGKKLTFKNSCTVTLAAGKSINGALAADVAVTLTPFANATLTVDAADSRKLTLDTAACTLTRGTLAVAKDATLVLGENFTVTAGTALVNNGTIPITATESLILSAGNTGNDGRIAGTGTIIAGKTRISGTWEASGTSGMVNITNTNDTGATITATVTSVFKAIATDAVITQTAGTGNVLTIGANTAIALGGNGITTAGSIVLKGAASDPGKLTFAAYGVSTPGTSRVTTTGGNGIAINGITKIAGNMGVGKGIAGKFNDAIIGNATTFSVLGGGAASNSITGGTADTILRSGAYPAGSFNNYTAQSRRARCQQVSAGSCFFQEFPVRKEPRIPRKLFQRGEDKFTGSLKILPVVCGGETVVKLRNAAVPEGPYPGVQLGVAAVLIPGGFRIGEGFPYVCTGYHEFRLLYRREDL